jgi:hypothetical protein
MSDSMRDGDPNWLLSTMDGKVWADEFCKVTGFADADWALTWFCNAIMVGWDHANRKNASEVASLTAQVETLRREREDVVDVLDAFAKCDEPKSLAQRIDDELKDFSMLFDHCSKAYDHMTNGRISNPATEWSSVKTIAEDCVTELVEEETRELQAQLSEAQQEIATYRTTVADEIARMQRITAMVERMQQDSETLRNALIEPPSWHRESLHERVERECWKQHHKDFKDCEEPACLLLKRIAPTLGWTIGINGLEKK